MFHSSVVLVLVVIAGLCLIGESGVIGLEKALQSYENDRLDKPSELDCDQFSDDLDVLRQFPFRIKFTPNTYDRSRSTATMHKNGTFVQSIVLVDEKFVPSSLFCLSNLEILIIYSTPFRYGIIPDALANLKKLDELLIYDSPIRKITERLESMTSVRVIQMNNCSLTYFPDLRNLPNLFLLDVPYNNLSRFDVPASIRMLDLSGNFLDEIPIHPKPENILFFTFDKNPLNNALPIILYKNAKSIHLQSTNITDLPPEIDQLQKLMFLDVSCNKLTHLPNTLLNLPLLEEFNATKNFFSSDDIVAIKKAFEKTRPEVMLDI